MAQTVPHGQCAVICLWSVPDASYHTDLGQLGLVSDLATQMSQPIKRLLSAPRGQKLASGFMCEVGQRDCRPATVSLFEGNLKVKELYLNQDATGMAALVANGEVSPDQLLDLRWNM